MTILASEQPAEGASPVPLLTGSRHTYRPSPNPRAAGACVKCGRPKSSTVHAYLELAHRAAVEAHLIRAQRAAHEGDMTEAIREAGHAVRLAQEEGLS